MSKQKSKKNLSQNKEGKWGKRIDKGLDYAYKGALLAGAVFTAMGKYNSMKNQNNSQS